MSLFNLIPSAVGKPAVRSKEEQEYPAIRPAYRVSETPDGWELTAVMPGVSKDHLEVTVEADTLVIHGKKGAGVPADWKAHHREIYPGGYELRVTLSDGVDGDRISATLEAGVLKLVLPKRESVKPRKIDIR
jgi:HSP20 family molecular chaperone IbpA